MLTISSFEYSALLNSQIKNPLIFARALLNSGNWLGNCAAKHIHEVILSTYFID